MSHPATVAPFNPEQGVFISDTPVFSEASLAGSMLRFIRRDEPYRYRFLQKHYGYAFDGYSHCGQADSTHQAADDMLHSFVFSDFYDVQRYPGAAPARERLSFAAFSLPRPGARLYRECGGEREYISAEAYFEDYLSLWDY